MLRSNSLDVYLQITKQQQELIYSLHIVVLNKEFQEHNLQEVQQYQEQVMIKTTVSVIKLLDVMRFILMKENIYIHHGVDKQIIV
jgi:hypothetical protein